jgi:hypothetical protein
MTLILSFINIIETINIHNRCNNNLVFYKYNRCGNDPIFYKYNRCNNNLVFYKYNRCGNDPIFYKYNRCNNNPIYYKYNRKDLFIREDKIFIIDVTITLFSINVI